MHSTGVQPIGGVIGGAQRHHIVERRGAQMLPETVVASPTGDGLVRTDGAGTPPGGRDLLVGAARPLADRDRARRRPTPCRSAGPTGPTCPSSGPSTGPDTGRSTQAAVQQAGHLGPGHGIARAVAKRALLAANGETVREQGVDVGLVGVAAGVGELPPTRPAEA